MNAAIIFDDLTMRFTRASGDLFTAVDHLTLHIAPGQVFGLLGPNGSGKTTTVNMLAGLLKPSEGSVYLHDIDVTRNVSQARARLGVVPQETALYNDLSALENLAFHARLYTVPPGERKTRIAEILDLVGLIARQNDRVGTYSGGMQRRLALARALLTRPDVIVLDEPTLGVDVQSRAAIWERVRTLAEEGKTVLLTTNYMEEAQALADRLAIIDHGALVAHGTPAELQQQAGQRFIDIEANWSLTHEVELRHLPGVQAVESHPPHMRVIAENQEQILPALLDYVAREKITPRSITMKEPDLNDVFLQLTGRTLRD